MNFNLLPAPMGGGFRMEGYWVWCGSVVKDEEGRFHMFASCWPTWLPMHPGWIVASEIVRAVADTPEGPPRTRQRPRGFVRLHRGVLPADTEAPGNGMLSPAEFERQQENSLK